MPYVYYDELPEGMEESNVVDRAEHETLLESLRTAESMRDAAIQRAEDFESQLHEQKKKYAETFLSKSPAPKGHEPVKEPNSTPQTFEDLFK